MFCSFFVVYIDCSKIELIRLIRRFRQFAIFSECMMIEIKRDIYLQRLVKRIGNGRAKVITGIRRCGKSYLLFTLFRKYLLSNYLPVVLKYLRAGCNAIDSRLGPAPAVYRAYWDSIRHDYLFDDDALELLRPISRHHFDYTALMMTRFSSMTAERMKLFTSEWVDRVPFDNNWSNHYFFTIIIMLALSFVLRTTAKLRA